MLDKMQGIGCFPTINPLLESGSRNGKFGGDGESQKRTKTVAEHVLVFVQSNKEGKGGKVKVKSSDRRTSQGDGGPEADKEVPQVKSSCIR